LLAQLFRAAKTLYEQIEATSKAISDTEVDESKDEADLQATLVSVNDRDAQLTIQRNSFSEYVSSIERDKNVYSILEDLQPVL
jgi:hypothetical protein